MKPYYEHAGITLYHGDSRDVLPTITGPVDLLLTDPPYGIEYKSSHRTVRTDVSAAIANDDSLVVVRDVLELAESLLANNRHAYWFASLDETLSEACACAPKGIEVRRTLVWDKQNWGMGDLECDYGQQCEAIIHGTKGKRVLNPPRPASLLSYSRESGATWFHPTPKPVELMKFLILKSTQPGELVLDPFAGGGASLVAAKALGRRAIGVEFEEKYCELIAERLNTDGAVTLIKTSFSGKSGVDTYREPL